MYFLKLVQKYVAQVATFTYHKYACNPKAYLTSIIYVILTTHYYVIWTWKNRSHPVIFLGGH